MKCSDYKLATLWYFRLCSGLSVVLSAVYSLYLYNRVAFGAYSKLLLERGKAWVLAKENGCSAREIKSIINQPGVYYEQCSEICGANYSLVPPIVVEGIHKGV